MAQSLLYSEHFKALQCHILETKEFRIQINPFPRFFELAWISSLVAYVTSILKFLLFFLKATLLLTDPVGFSFFELQEVVSWGFSSLTRWSVFHGSFWWPSRLIQTNTIPDIQCDPTDVYIVSLRQRITVSLVLRGVHRLWELSNHIILLTETSVNLFTDMTQFTKGHSFPFLYNMQRTISSLC